MNAYKCLQKGGTGQIEEKKSRFIANIKPVNSETEATAFIAEIKKKYWDARHNCSAFVIGEKSELTRCSDDGEPAGTAGRPMLEVLLSEEITNVCVVVTRYFGGTLLGTGGLIRAYQGAVKAGLEDCKVVMVTKGTVYSVVTDYNLAGKLQFYFNKESVIVKNTDWASDVAFTIVLTEDNEATVLKQITELTAALATVTKGEECEVMIDTEVRYADGRNT